MKKKNIIVLCGGDSSESEVSLKTGKMIFSAIDRKKYTARILDTKKDLFRLLTLAKNKKIDLVFIALHGSGGEDGKIQGLLDSLKIKYTGSGVLASAISMDKEMTKIILEKNKIKTPDFKIIKKGERINNLIPIPFVLKPVSQGSSVGVEIIKNKKELQKKLNKIFKIDEKAIIENYIKGTEISVGVIGRNKTLKTLPVIEIVPKNQEFFNYRAKYRGESEEIVPARISFKLAQKAQRIALKVHKLIDLRDMSRTDMIIKNGELFVIETNTIPGMTKESLLPKEAKAAGIDFKHLIEFFIKTGLKND